VLISNCADPLYVRGHIGYTMLAAEGLFPPRFDFVELFVDGATRGVYTLIEKADTTVKRDFPFNTAVLRRTFSFAEVEGIEVRDTATTPQAALAAYERILSTARPLAGAALEAALRARMDLDQYLRWIALMNLLRNGDYIDEVIFFAHRSTDATGAPADYFQIMGWDPDDIFASCHSSPGRALTDPNGLLICAEAELGKKIFGDPLIYARYVDTLAALIERTPTDRFAGVVNATVGRLLPFLENPTTAEAMRTGGDRGSFRGTTFAALKDEYAAESAALVRRFDEQRKKLLAAIAVYRGQR
jgi:hypothetical protein